MRIFLLKWALYSPPYMNFIIKAKSTRFFVIYEFDNSSVLQYQKQQSEYSSPPHWT